MSGQRRAEYSGISGGNPPQSASRMAVSLAASGSVNRRSPLDFIWGVGVWDRGVLVLEDRRQRTPPNR
ncbi:MAG: hypothetical protein R6U98_04605 [Pirellulaceae bacterium]